MFTMDKPLRANCGRLLWTAPYHKVSVQFVNFCMVKMVVLGLWHICVLDV